MLLIKWNAFANSESSFTVIVGLNTPSRIPFEMVLNSLWLCTWVAVGITCLIPQPCRLVTKLRHFHKCSFSLWRQFFDTSNEHSSSPVNTKHLHFSPCDAVHLCRNYCGDQLALLWLHPSYHQRWEGNELSDLRGAPRPLMGKCASPHKCFSRTHSHFLFTQLLRLCHLHPELKILHN